MSIERTFGIGVAQRDCFLTRLDSRLQRKGTERLLKHSNYDHGVSSEGPSIFISYQHDDKAVALALAEGLEAEGLRVWIDENDLEVGGSLIEQLATAVEGVDFFLALVSATSVTSRWCQKEISMALTDGLGREGIKVIPVRVGDVEMPATLTDLYWLQLDPDDVSVAVKRLARDVRRHHERKQEVGARAITEEDQASAASVSGAAPQATPGNESEPIKIIGVVKEGVSKPREDGTRGSALYRIPLRLSRPPSALWSRVFRETWDRPPRWTTMHRPGIGSVQGDTIVLNGTTMDELEKYHVETLRHVIEKVNRDVSEVEVRQRNAAERQQKLDDAHRFDIDEISERLDFE